MTEVATGTHPSSPPDPAPAIRSLMPPVQYAGQVIDLRAEARRSRQRLYPVSLVYSAYALGVTTLAARAVGPWSPAGYFLAGLALWTLVEYLVHRWILHGRFPDDKGLVRHWLHVAFDTLHTEHHARPWDGNHINGTLKDTALYVALVAALCFLAPIDTAPVLFGAFLLAYVAEEWTHHAVHFMGLYHLRGPYWRYITRHHSYHHSPRGSELAFGLTNGAWDIAFDTRIPPRDRALLYARR